MEKKSNVAAYTRRKEAAGGKWEPSGAKGPGFDASFMEWCSAKRAPEEKEALRAAREARHAARVRLGFKFAACAIGGGFAFTHVRSVIGNLPELLEALGVAAGLLVVASCIQEAMERRA